MDQRLLDRLCTSSVRRHFLPETDVEWHTERLTEARAFMPGRLLSIASEPENDALDEPARETLARHEVASLYSFVIRLENVLVRRFSTIVQRSDPSLPHLPYLLHEIEEESRHNRMFIRFLAYLGAGTYPPHGALGWLEYRLGLVATRRQSMFIVLTLVAEAIPDFFHDQWTRLSGIDPVLRRVSTIHRVEESRHMVFAEKYLEDLVAGMTSLERRIVATFAPIFARVMFDNVVPPHVYLRTGLCATRRQAYALWWRVSRSQVRRRLREEALAPLFERLLRAGILDDDARAWWRALGVAA